MILQQLPYRKSFFSNVYIDHIICGIFGISLLAQLVMNPLAMWETWVRSLGWQDLLEKGKVMHSIILT